MTEENLKKANDIQKEMKELENFIWHAERIWTGKIIKQTQKYIFKANGYGYFEDAEYNLSTEIKDRMLEVLKEYLEELKTKLNNL